MCIGCGGSRHAADNGINTGLALLAAGDPDPVPAPAAGSADLTPAQSELARLAEESARNLQALFEQLNQGAPAVPDAPRVSLAESLPPGSAPVVSAEAEQPVHDEPLFAGVDRYGTSPVPSPMGSYPDLPTVAAVADADAEPELPPAEIPPARRPLAERIQEHSIVLVDLLRQQAASGSMPMRSYLALASLEVLRPGALQKIITPRATSETSGLSPEQWRAVEAFRDFVLGAGSLIEQPGMEADRLAELAEELIASRPMRMRHTTLCSRVSGFGQYVPLRSTRFLQGHNHPMIIYTEVHPFAYRPATSAEAARAAHAVGEVTGELLAVELSQEVHVYHEADGLLVWSRPEQGVLEVSRNRRRDFFLINEIVLPRSLSVGRYNMKVIMRDKTSGAVDEAILTFEVVADPALARAAHE